MKKLKMASVMKDESGSVIVVGLALIFLFFIIMLWTVRLTLNVGSADADLKNAVAIAAKMAAQQVDPESQAYGDPRIIPDEAEEAFREFLAANLGLDKETLEPLEEGSAWLEKPDYKLYVYNGSGDFNVLKEEMYASEKNDDTLGVLVTDISGDGFPALFSVVDSEGEVEVELPTPGVIAVVKAKPVGVFGKPVDYTRWATARIHKNWVDSE